MKKIKFKKHKAGRGGWSEWVQPKMEGFYLFKCCDCGLVHEMEFATFLKRGKSGVKLPTDIRAMFRARRMKLGALKGIIIKSKSFKK